MSKAAKASTPSTDGGSPRRNTMIQIGFLTHDVSLLRHNLFDRHVNPAIGVTRMQWRLLINLTRHGGQGATQVELADLLGVGKVALGKMLDRMEGNGLVVRVPDRDDRRSKRIDLTQKGQTVIDRMERIALELSASIMKDIPPQKQEELRDLLLTMKRNLLALEGAEAPSGGSSADCRPAPARQTPTAGRSGKRTAR